MDASQTIDKILSAKYCGDVFSFSLSTLKTEYKEMAKLIHPDICGDPRADQAMQKLNELLRKAESSLKSGESWCATGKTWIRASNVKTGYATVSYRLHDSFEFGERFVCNTSVMYLFSPGTEKYWRNAEKMAKSIRYAGEDMRKEMERYMPKVKMTFDTPDGGHAIVLDKPKDAYPLDLFLKKQKNALDDRHAAWIMSRLCNLCCFFEYNRVAYNAFTIQNLFIRPADHTILALGGWWYSVPVGSRMIGAPRVVFEQMPEYVRFQKVGSTVTDLESVKEMARNLFHTAPDAIKQWMNAGSSDSAVKEFDRWNSAIEKGYGKRRFILLEVDENDLYNEGKISNGYAC